VIPARQSTQPATGWVPSPDPIVDASLRPVESYFGAVPIIADSGSMTAFAQIS